MMYFLYNLWLRLYGYYFTYIVLTPDERSDFKKTIKKLDTPEKVQAWLYVNVKYSKDNPSKPLDSWQSPERTFKRKRGDCEDNSLFGLRCLKDKYVCYVLCIYTKSSGHATLLIKEPKGYTSIGTYGLMEHETNIPKIIPNWIGYDKWTRYKLMDENLRVIERGVRK